MQKTTIVIADDHEMVRRGLRTAYSFSPRG